MCELHIVPDPVCNIRELEAVGLLTVDVKHGDGGDSGTKGGEAEDEHGSGVGGVGLVGFAYEHRDDGTSKVLDKKDHRKVHMGSGTMCKEAYE